MKRIPNLILLLLFLQSCGFVDTEQTVAVENQYSLSIPSYLTKTNDLNEDASLQYQNPWRELYLIVIDEPKIELRQALLENDLGDLFSDDIQGYAELILTGMKEGLLNPVQSEIRDTTINQMPTRFATLRGSIDGIDIFYCIGFYEGRETYYQVISWTLFSRRHTNQKKMRKILYSLKEL